MNPPSSLLLDDDGRATVDDDESELVKDATVDEDDVDSDWLEFSLDSLVDDSLTDDRELDADEILDCSLDSLVDEVDPVLELSLDKSELEDEVLSACVLELELDVCPELSLVDDWLDELDELDRS